MSCMILSNKNTLIRDLKSHKWTKSNQWGSPSGWGENSIFYTKVLKVTIDGRIHEFSIFYFTPEFTKYVTPFAWKGMNPANKLLITSDNASIDWISPFNIKDYMDITTSIDAYKSLLRDE